MPIEGRSGRCCLFFCPPRFLAEDAAPAPCAPPCETRPLEVLARSLVEALVELEVDRTYHLRRIRNISCVRKDMYIGEIVDDDHDLRELFKLFQGYVLIRRIGIQ